VSYLLAGFSIIAVNIFNIIIQEKAPLIAVLPFKATGIDHRLGIVVSNTVRNSLVKQRKKVIRKDKMEHIFRALEIPESECNERSCGVYFGRILKVDKAIVGEIIFRGEEVLITFSMIDIASTFEEKSVQGILKFSSNIKPYTNKSRELSYKLLGNKPPGLSNLDKVIIGLGTSSALGYMIYNETKTKYGTVEIIVEFP